MYSIISVYVFEMQYAVFSNITHVMMSEMI